MIIAQISDTHITKHGQKTYGIAPMAENLSSVVEHINKSIPPVDVVIVTGDISANGLLEETECAAEILNKLKMPFYIIPGNHDKRETLLTTFDKKVCPTESEEFIHFALNDYEVRLIGLDSTIPDKPGGEMCASRLAWLEQQLAEEKEKPTVIFMHHSPVKFGVPESDLDGFIGADRLGQIIKKYSNIERLLCGHIHLHANARWNGTIVCTAPSTGMSLVLDLTMKQESEFFLEYPAYLLHYYSEDKNFVTHTIHVHDNIKSYLFEEYF